MIDLRQNKSTTNESNVLGSRIRKFLISTFVYLAIVFSLLSMFNIQNVSKMAIIPGLLLIMLMNVYKDPKMRVRLSFIIGLLLIVFFFVQNSYILNGLFLTVNQITETIGRQTGFILSPYKIAIDPETFSLAISYVWGYICILMALLCYFTIQSGRNFLLWLVILPLFLIQLYSGIMPGMYQNMMLFISGVLLIHYSFIKHTKKNELVEESKNSTFLFTSAVFLLLFGFVFLIMNFIEPVDDYSKAPVVQNLQHSISDSINDFRYEKNKTNSLTQGDFTRLGELDLHDEEALEVIMDQPTSLYLRGFVGSNYTSKQWTELDHDVAYESHGLFYWLHESGFSPLNQLNMVHNVGKDEINEKINITINNTNANSEYLYTPYELQSKPSHFEGVYTPEDSAFLSNSFFGDRLYSYQSSSNLVKKYPKLASQLYAKKDSNKAKDYLKNETHYNEFVYENYTHLSKQSKVLLKNQIEIKTDNEERLSYEKAIDEVRSYLNETLNYKVNSPAPPQGRDFLAHLLEDTKQGYATHFATAGTLMFRYLGIPSRYVEGYLITPEDVKDISEYEKMSISGANAHAWTEIYLDEMGWIPIEVTPPYYETMEKTDLSNYPKGDINSTEGIESNEGTAGDSLNTNEEVVEKDHKGNTSDPKPKESSTLFTTFMIGLIILVVLMLVCYFIYVMKKRLELRAFKKGFNDPNYQVAIPKIFAYCMTLLHYDGLPTRGGSTYNYRSEIREKHSDEYARKFEQVLQINQASLFSNQEISKKQYDQVHQFMDQLLEDLFHSKSIFKRIKMKFFDFIY